MPRKKKRLFVFEVCHPHDVYFPNQAEDGRRQFKPEEKFIGGEWFLNHVGKYLRLVEEVTGKKIEKIDVGAKMFLIENFKSVKDANGYILKVLGKLDLPTKLEFQVIHSLSETECAEDGGSLDSLSNILLSYLRDLDSQQGYMIYDKDHWDFIDWEEPYGSANIYRPPSVEETFVTSGEGLVVIHNKFSICENEFPIVVVKKAFWEQQRESLLEKLKTAEAGGDYTSKISPALYIELFYAENQNDQNKKM
jgi:hypothetical protein